MSNCRGCGTVLDPTEEQVNQAVDEVLESSVQDAVKKGGVCPLCGHSKHVPPSQRKSVQFALLLMLLTVAGGVAIAYYSHRYTERNEVAQGALRRLQSNPDVARLMGSPLSIQGQVEGEVREDETGWREVKLAVPVHGPKDEGLAHVIGGREKGPWTFTTFEIEIKKQHKRINLITGTVTDYDPAAYQQVHTQGATIPSYLQNWVPEPRFAPEFPCVWLEATPSSAPNFGNCSIPIPFSSEMVDRFEVDLRTGRFVLRQTDLSLSDGFEVRLNRTYTAQDWIHPRHDHAFGFNSNHPYDIAPVGTRNPYTEHLLVLEDADFLYLPRISSGTGYSDAVYQHSETSSSFYKAVTRWVGDGWELKLEDGSKIRFPDSYNAINMAQGAPTWMVDKHGDKAELIRDRQRNLLEIRTPRGRWIRFHYDARSHIVRAEDDQGHWAAYSYNADGLLTDVVHSDKHERHYSYAGKLMTDVRDENHRLLIHNSYDSGWVIRQDFPNGASARYHYDYGQGNRHYAQQATVTFSDGSVKKAVTGDSVSFVIKRPD